MICLSNDRNPNALISVVFVDVLQEVFQGHAAGSAGQEIEHGIPGEGDRAEALPSQVDHRQCEGWYPQGTNRFHCRFTPLLLQSHMVEIVQANS